LQIAAAGSRARNAVGAAMAMLLALYAASTMRTERYWHDDVTFFQRCVEIGPYDSNYRLNLAAAMNHARDFEGAAREFERVTALQPDQAYFHLKLAQQYQMMGRQLDFERELQKYTELSAATIQRQRAAESSGASQPAGAP
jgi:predicted Zn-dependent protease